MKTNILLTLFLLGYTCLQAQSHQTKVGDKFFKNYSYVKASEFYEEAVKKGDSSEHVLTRLGDCYYNNSNSEKAAYWYGEAVNKYPENINTEYYYKLSQALRGNGNYEEAISWLEKFKETNAEDDRIKGIDFSDIELYKKLSNTDEVYVETVNLPINSKFSDFGAFKYKDHVYFSSARKGVDKLYGWNNEPFLDIYQVSIKNEEDGYKETYGTVKSFDAKGVNSEFHEANITITSDGQTMYFTRDNVSKRNRLKTDKDGTSHLKIYKASLVDSVWANIKECPFNDKLYSSGHPTLSPDDKTLYFVSDREGGYGQTDIYRVSIHDDGTYGAVENMGPTINTDGKEMFPFVAKDSTFYFSSDSNLSLGFLDIFKSDILKQSNDQPQNLGAPYNSGFDDFAFSINPEEGIGYLSSNRSGGEGSDDIYRFMECFQMVEGTVINSKSLDSLSMATLQLIDEDGRIVKEVQTDENGHYNLKIKCNSIYTILAKKEDYKETFKPISTDLNNRHKNNLDFGLIPLIVEDEIVINPIFFDFDKWDIRPDASYELESIVDVMRSHPGMVIKIESHTDSRGPDQYNLALSDHRAKSTRDYLLSRGITPERIESAIGYGETQPVNDCTNGVNCTEEQHQANRRSKFIILRN